MATFINYGSRHLGAYVKAIGTLMIKYNKSGVECEKQYRDEVKALMMAEGVPEELATPTFAIMLSVD